MAKATIADIAREANVSVTTVSRFINGNYGKMSEATKNRVQETVDRLQYHPRASAQKMRQDHTHVVGVIVADISNVFSSLLFKGIYTELQPAGYDVMLMNSNNSLGEESDEIGRLLSQEVDGLIIQPNARDFSAYASITDNRTPLVMVDRRSEGQPATVSSVTADNRESCLRLGLELARRGYENILPLSRTGSQISAQSSRVEGFQEAGERTGSLVMPMEVGDHGQEWIGKELDRTVSHLKGKTAIISLIGPLLFDLLDVFKGLDWSFPEDIGLVSFDDWSWSRYVGDGIYLLQQDPQALGQACAHNLLEQMGIAAETGEGDPYGASRQITLPVACIEAPSI
ncbi:transcriptional regulator [Bifidobacterium aemilianum]|uniref:Transcriptional regulator n=1 Tax=Bifidobacterium aemilianum TaxID=2493120 RepID=A0A366KAI5_9BIFI|nr:LacI family DNA-binding transcriptional regulator [Bifidobacterium aemilianum]RBP98123.1 transcriptional regulator [Bifidobacterium aemilianum]